MTVELGVFAPGRLEILRRLLSDPSLAPEFEALQGPQGLERVLADPFSGPELRWLAFRDGEPAGFCWAFVIPTREGSFAMLRPGVVARARRTCIGSRLIETASAAVRARSRRFMNKARLASAWRSKAARARASLESKLLYSVMRATPARSVTSLMPTLGRPRS